MEVPHTKAKVSIGGQIVEIGDTFRHSLCHRLSITNWPFDDLTCSVCLGISQKGDFRLRVLQEDCAHEKRGSWDTV